MSPRQFGILLLLAALWGASFLFMRVAAPSLGPVWLIEGRVAIAGLVLLPLLAGFGPIWAQRGEVMLVGLLNAALPFVLIAWATTMIAAGVASLLNATVPLFSALFGFLVLRERLRPVQVGGIFLGFLGVAVLATGRYADLRPPPPLATIACLGACLSYVLAAHYTRHRMSGLRPIEYVVGTQLAAAVWLLPLVPIFVPGAMPGPVAWWSLLGLGVFSTAVAFWLYFRLIHEVGATRALTVTYLIPLFAVAWGHLLLDEPIGSVIWLSGALILLGTALSHGRSRARSASEKALSRQDPHRDGEKSD